MSPSSMDRHLGIGLQRKISTNNQCRIRQRPQIHNQPYLLQLKEGDIKFPNSPTLPYDKPTLHYLQRSSL